MEEVPRHHVPIVALGVLGFGWLLLLYCLCCLLCKALAFAFAHGHHTLPQRRSCAQVDKAIAFALVAFGVLSWCYVFCFVMASHMAT